ncbi:S-layer homology domain-containing protein [Oscillospiraceae bacterium OttesenSCG-928-F05]|nr:S-layer homology domain-containing protein [Oscillospiraceae bacterium OttesenSCG-928-F05]
MMMKRVFALALCLVLLTGLCMSAGAVTLSDLDGHWARTQILEWIDKGFITGYADGTFKPGNPIKRGEFMALTNRAFGFSTRGVINFSDVPPTKWYYDDVRIAVQAGYIGGYPDGTMQPEAPIRRQEVAKILMSLLALQPNENGSTGYTDYKTFDNWAKGPIGAVTSASLMGGYTDGSFGPFRNITRAEAVVALNNALNKRGGATTPNEINSDLYVRESSYGSATQRLTLNANLHIDYAGNVTVRNMDVKGNATVYARVDDKTVALENLTITGTLYVSGGSKITLTGCIVEKIEVDSADVEIIASGGTVIGKTTVAKSASLTETGLTGGSAGFKNVTLAGSASTATRLDGDFDRVDASTARQRLNITRGTVDSVTLDTSNNTVVLAGRATINTLTLDAAATVYGTGRIKEAYINRSGSQIQPTPDKTYGSYSAASVTTYSYTFTVESAETGRTVRYATVDIPELFLSGETDSNGRVTFDDVPAHIELTVTVSHSDYGTYTGTFECSSGYRSSLISLPPKGDYSAEIRVYDRDTNAVLSGAVVRNTTLGIQSTTNSNGRATLSNLQLNKTYTYTVSLDGYATSTGNTIKITENNQIDTVYLTKSSGSASLTVYATLNGSSSRLSYSSFNVTLYRGSTTYPVTSRNSDYWYFEGLERNVSYNYTVTGSGITYSGSITLTSGSNTLTVPLANGYTVTVNAADSLKNAGLQVSFGGYGTYSGNSLSYSSDGRTATCTFANVPHGATATLTVSATGYATQTINVTTGQNSMSRTVSLVKNSVVNVRITVKNKDGSPIEKVSVNLSDYSGAPVLTNAQGIAEFYDITPGNHTVYLTPPANSGYATPSNGVITVSHSGVTAQNITLTGTSISLRVVRDDAGNPPVAGVLVTLSSGSGTYSGSTNDTGSTVISAPPGIYTVTVSGSGSTVYTVTPNDPVSLAQGTGNAKTIMVTVSGVSG